MRLSRRPRGGGDALCISEIEAGRLTLDLADFDLCTTVQEACSAAHLELRGRGLQLDLQIDTNVPRHVHGDAERLRQVLIHLLSSAVRFARGGTVTVRLCTSPESAVRVEVTTDTGSAPIALNDVFEPFTRADSSTTRIVDGARPGLAIARELVDTMGGTIGALSHPGHRSTFWFEPALGFPCETAAQRPAHAQPSRWDDAPIVLVVDDSHVNQIVAVRTLERCGYRADVAADGLQALIAAEHTSYDAVLMDCQMPLMDGYEATAELRRREEGSGRHVPIIAMTACAMHGDRERCLAAGMDDYITKPVRSHELTEILGRWVATRPDRISTRAGARRSVAEVIAISRPTDRGPAAKTTCGD